MITSGYPYISARKTEVVDVESGETCADLADFPVENEGAVGANLNGTPIVCGGHDYPTKYYQKFNKVDGNYTQYS